MSNYVFPTLPGMAVESELEPTYRTDVFESPGGSEQRVAWRATPRTTYSLHWSILRDDVAAPAPWNAYSELGALLWFWKTHQGPADSFYFTDPHARKNLLAYSQDFSQAAWSKAGITVTPDAVAAPDGTTTADQLTSGAGDAAIVGGFTPSALVIHALSVWLRASTPRTVNIYLLRNSPFANIAEIFASVVSAWTHFTVSGTPLDLTQHQLQIGGGSTLPSGATIYAWGAQAEPASSAGLYVPTEATASNGQVRVRFAEDGLRQRRIVPGWYDVDVDLITAGA